MEQQTSPTVIISSPSPMRFTSYPMAPNHDVTDPSPTHSGEIRPGWLALRLRRFTKYVYVCLRSANQAIPAAGALIAPVESAAGVKPYYVWKPNPLIMRHALEVLQSKRIHTIIIGDRMDTDILAGLEASMDSAA
eukprot:jgi/Chlat1/8957/Chrsp94S08331